MNRGTPVIGVLGAVLGVGGMIAYTLAPQALWIVTLVEGVALMCLTWFFVAHFETLKAFSVKRSTRLGANSILIVLLFLGILGIVNFLAARHSVRWDLSESRRFTLAPQTYEVLKTLSRDVQPEHFNRLIRGLVETKDLLYFLSGTILMLFLAHRVIETHRWT